MLYGAWGVPRQLSGDPDKHDNMGQHLNQIINILKYMF